MFRKFSLLMLAVLFLVSPSLAFAGESEVNGRVVPDKVEYIESAKGLLIPVYYFDDPEDAELFKQQRISDMNNAKLLNNKSPDASIYAISFAYEEYLGVRPYDYSYVYTRNTTNEPLPWTRTVKRTYTSETSVSVGAGFKQFFEASVGGTWGTEIEYEDTFEIEIPPHKQAEIWTWNDAEYHTFSYRNCGLLGCGEKTYFNAINPTNNYGSDIVITNFRNPG